MRLTLQITVAALVSFAGLLLALAETEDPSGLALGAFTLPIALLGFFFVDRQPILRLHPNIVLALGAGAFALAYQEFASGEIEGRLLAASHLLVYLTWVFLIQVKTSREYWWLHALAALQIALAAVLTAKPWLGAALLACAFLGSWSLTIFLVTRSVEAALSPADWQKRIPTSDRRLPLGQFRSGLAYDQGHQLVNWRFVGNTMVLTLLGLVFSFGFFLFTPRIWLGSATLGGESTGGRTVGFSESVRLGDLGTTLESDEVALVIRVFDVEEERYLTKDETIRYFDDEPLFRGAVLEVYEDGSWKREPEPYRELPRWGELPRSARSILRYRHDITSYSTGSVVLFANGQLATAEGSRGERLEQAFWSRELTNSKSIPLQAMEYKAFPYSPEQQRANLQLSRSLTRGEYRYLDELQMTPNNLTRLPGLIRDIVRQRFPDRSPSPLEIILAFESHLRDSGDYGYTLNLSIDDNKIDPVEDFLFNRKQGHCEYFASALALMLRTAGIPSRVVSGFKGGAWDDKRQAFVVQQLHAHAWVESLIFYQSEEGVSVRDWIVSDPTPGGRGDDVRSRQGAAPTAASWGSAMTRWWSMSVQMTKGQQQDMVYRPFSGIAESAQRVFENPLAFVSESARSLRTSNRGFFWTDYLKAGGAAGLVVLLFWGLYRGVRQLRWLRTGNTATMDRARVAFYERFQAILKSQGLERGPSQTALEFAQQAILRFNSQLAAGQMASWPQSLAQRFYDVRYGGEAILPNELIELDQRLTDLERCLKRTPRP